MQEDVDVVEAHTMPRLLTAKSVMQQAGSLTPTRGHSPGMRHGMRSFRFHLLHDVSPYRMQFWDAFGLFCFNWHPKLADAPSNFASKS